VTTATAPRVVEDALYRRLCEFCYDEADLLSQRHYAKWFALLAEDIHYRVGFPEFYEHGAQRKVGIGNPYFDDNHISLKVRVQLLGNPTTTTAENPPSVYNYFVTNIRARWAADEADALDVESRLLVYRVRASEPVPYILGARRKDRLRVDGEGFRIARREAMIDQSIIQSPNLSFLL
jgi:3-phenylpropionate/cinnamic acid dioxygenase small subunit